MTDLRLRNITTFSQHVNRNIVQLKVTSFCNFQSRIAHLPDDPAALVEGDDGLGGFVIKVQALLNGLLVVIGTAAGLSTLHQPLHHRLWLCVDVQQQLRRTDLKKKHISITAETLLMGS